MQTEIRSNPSPRTPVNAPPSPLVNARVTRLTNEALDYADAIAEGHQNFAGDSGVLHVEVDVNNWSIEYHPSSDWAIAGPLIEKGSIDIYLTNQTAYPTEGRWMALTRDNQFASGRWTCLKKVDTSN